MMKLAEYLESVEKFGIKLGLAQTTELMTRAGYCTEQGRKPHFIHLAGSNGKGSTGAMLQKALIAAGKKVGFYTSPHLAAYNERIRVNGEMISDDKLEEEFQQLFIHAEEMKKDGKFVTYFEFTTILALGCFLHCNVDFIIWETGMGGRFDSTNIIMPEASVITNIALEHCQYLGDTLEKIAFEKGGIIKENTPVFCGIMPSCAREVLKNIAAEKNAPFTAVTEEFPLISRENMCQKLRTPSGEVSLALGGNMQRKNFTLVYSILEYLSWKFELDLTVMLGAMSHVSWPGRFQLLADGTVLDGGHNPDGVAALCQGLKEFFPGEKFTFVFASFEDKDTAQCIKLLLPLAHKFCFVPLAYSHRPSCSTERLTELADGFPHVETYASLDEYLQKKSNSDARQVVCGSLYLLGEYFNATKLEGLKII
ncbi:MAG: bifunctional folylpolyglutamate synthase/dihydrofolate synthase [Lentisphaeria bacterium]|nr:bifunctional folylpolyglutamate synthase/dihydrofolate synthase [Lentisphaeria bacterium]